MSTVEVELLRRTLSGTVGPWYLLDDGREPVLDIETRDAILALLARLDIALPVAGTVELGPAALAALEQTTVTLTGIGGLATQATLASVLAALGGTLAVQDVHDGKTPGIRSGTGGSCVLAPGVRLESVSALESSGDADGTFTIMGQDAITVRAGKNVDLNPRGAFVAVTVTFSATLDWIVETSS